MLKCKDNNNTIYNYIVFPSQRCGQRERTKEIIDFCRENDLPVEVMVDDSRYLAGEEVIDCLIYKIYNKYYEYVYFYKQNQVLVVNEDEIYVHNSESFVFNYSIINQ